MTAESLKRQMTDIEWNRIYEMSRDKNLYMNLCSSLFPTIHGSDEVKRGNFNHCFFLTLKLSTFHLNI